MIGTMVPHVHFPIRVRDDSIEGPNPYRWDIMSSTDIFENRKVVVFSLPGAFTPTCSTYQLPHFERLWAEFMRHGIDDIYCLSVNDSFVMNAWGKSQNLERIKLIPDGSGHFTRLMGMLVNKDNLGFGYRSWRYAMVVQNYVITEWFEEPGREDNCENDPYFETDPHNILRCLMERETYG